MSVTIKYNGSNVATVEGGKIATLPVENKKMVTDIIVTVPESKGEVLPDHTESDFTLQLANIASGELGVVYSSTEKVAFDAAPNGKVIDTFVDTNFLPSNIKKDVEIFGVTGEYGGDETGDDAIDDYLDAINGEKVGEGALGVTFIGADGKVLCTVPVYEGNDCEDPVESGIISTPTKTSTNIYKYPFIGWSDSADGEVSTNILKNITENKTVYAIFSIAYNFIAEGYCTDGDKETQIKWGLHPDYALRIMGDGDFSRGGYNTYASRIKSVIISAGITMVGTYAFADHTALTSVSLPNTLKTIGTLSFVRCAMLTNIKIPASVTQIKADAFSQAGLTSVVFEKTAGWYHAPIGGTEDIISASELAKPDVAARYLIETYVDENWRRNA